MTEQLNTGVNPGGPKGSSVPVPQVTLVKLLLNDTKVIWIGNSSYGRHSLS
jgi:hypothetical protein